METELKKLLDDPRTWLIQSYNTNKTRTAILWLFEELRDELKDNTWISIEDRLPQEDEETELILANKVRWMVFSWFYDEHWFYKMDFEDDKEHKSERFVTHWMSLPSIK